MMIITLFIVVFEKRTRPTDPDFHCCAGVILHVFFTLFFYMTEQYLRYMGRLGLWILFAQLNCYWFDLEKFIRKLVHKLIIHIHTCRLDGSYFVSMSSKQIWMVAVFPFLLLKRRNRRRSKISNNCMNFNPF